MNQTRRFWDWLRGQWASGSTGKRLLIILGGLFLWPFLAIGLLIALVYEIVAAVDRGGRLTPQAHWAIAALATIGVLMVMSLASPRTAADTAVDSTEPPATMTPEPSAAESAELAITYPSGGAVVTSSMIEVTGIAPKGAEVVRDIHWAPDDRVTAGPDGSWSMVVELSVGSNELVFRIGEDKSTERLVIVEYVEPTPPPLANTPTPEVTPTPAPTGTPTVAPTATSESWPSAFELWACEGVSEIDDAGGHLAEAGSAAQDFDIDRMVDEADKAAEDAGQARDALDRAPAWGPGQDAVDALSETAQLTLEAANLLKLGAQTLNADVLNEAAAKMEEAFDAKVNASMQLVTLQGETGFTCF